MAQDINKVIVVGNVCRDVELRMVGNNIPTATFAIAVNGPRGADDVNRVDYPNIVVWRKLAEICAQYLRKGSKVAVEGRLQTRNFERNGQKVYVTEVVADQIQFLSPRNQTQQPESTVTPTGNVTEDGFNEVADDELPFD